VDFSLGGPPQVPYGGGKLGIYSFWPYTGTKPTQPDTSRGQQFEFYNYSSTPPTPPDNLSLPTPLVRYGETLNQVQLDAAGAVAKGVSGMYQTNFGDANVQNELYSFSMPDIHVPVPNYITSGHTTALATYLAYVSAAQNPSDTTWQT
jgi:hypothetical protein